VKLTENRVETENCKTKTRSGKVGMSRWLDKMYTGARKLPKNYEQSQ